MASKGKIKVEIGRTKLERRIVKRTDSNGRGLPARPEKKAMLRKQEFQKAVQLKMCRTNSRSFIGIGMFTQNLIKLSL